MSLSSRRSRPGVLSFREFRRIRLWFLLTLGVYAPYTRGEGREREKLMSTMMMSAKSRNAHRPTYFYASARCKCCGFGHDVKDAKKIKRGIRSIEKRAWKKDFGL